MNPLSVSMSEFYIHDRFPMYVQKWAQGQAQPERKIVLVPGGAHTGMCWTTCPDGRPGWAPHLAAHGWTAFVVDWAGVGRSPRPDDFLTAGAAPTVAALSELYRLIGPAALIGHSIGAAISAKVMDEVPHLVSGFIALNPAPPVVPGRQPTDIPVGHPPLPPEDRPVRFNEAAARQFFSNAPRFPQEAFSAYHRSLCDISPSIFREVGLMTDSPALAISDTARISAIPSIVIAGDNDQLVPEVISRAAAESLQCEHVMVGRDWGLDGFGHLIPIETGSEEILFKALTHLEHLQVNRANMQHG